MHDHIYSCLYIFTHITLSDATITDVGNLCVQLEGHRQTHTWT